MSTKTQKEEGNYKVIVAIKCAKEHSHVRPPSVRCTISIQEKQKSSTLPFSEGQFFEIKELDESSVISLAFHLEKSNKEIGTSYIKIPDTILLKEEIEIANDFVFNYVEKDVEGTFRGSYYIIILNKKQFLQKDDSAKKQVQINVKDESPKPQALRAQASLSSKSPGVKKQGSTAQVQKPNKEEELKRQASAKKLQDRVESSVKNAMKEMNNSKNLESNGQHQHSHSEVPNQKSQGKGLTRGATLIADLEGQSPTRISNQVQLTRSGTLGQSALGESSELLSRSGASPLKLQTFNVDDSPSRSQARSTSPGKHHHEGYNTHNHSTLACLYYLDSANMSDQLKTQADYFKKVIYNLTSKIEGLKCTERSNERLNGEVKRQDQQIKDLEKLLVDAQDSLKGLGAEINCSLDQAEQEKNDLENRLKLRNDQYNDLERKNASLEHKLEQQQNQMVQMDRRVTELLATTRQSKQNEAKLDENDRTILDNLKNYENKIRELQAVVANFDKQKQEVQQELNKSNQAIVALKGELSDQQHKNKELLNELGVSDRKLQVYKAQDANIKALSDQIAQLQKDILEQGRQKQHIEGENLDLKKEIQNLRSQLSAQEKVTNERMNSLRQKIVEVENRVNQLQSEIDILSKDNIKFRQENKDLQRDIKLTKDQTNQIETEKNKNAVLLKSFKDSQAREKELALGLKEANALLFQSRQEIADLQAELLETQQYCAQLKKLILEMKEAGVCYIPFHNDPIDKALSEYINSLNDPERIKDLFVRESEGVYLFGSKRVFAKVEQDRILIRTGGGFMGIEEFFDLYGNSESEKIDKADPKRQYDQNKLITDKVEQGRVIRETKRQYSPVRNKSPNH